MAQEVVEVLVGVEEGAEQVHQILALEEEEGVEDRKVQMKSDSAAVMEDALY